MKIPGVNRWMQVVLCYWLVVIVIVSLEIRYMDSSWAGLPGFLLSLPLSAFVVTAYILASYAYEVHGYNIRITEYHIEYGFLICAFLNAFIVYAFYRWRTMGRETEGAHKLPPPPSHF